ncbi:sulfotransferase family protein [Altibacter lentus]|uniref:sulfotransferase family protein n=1 Tax=Altibacter lentus TaxID=1223410 RepID=UPI000558D557|nr:sulfotransferase [Altibacter lentus]
MSNFLWNQPIFILGNPRSGTSLLRIMLHSHPEICIPPESHFFLWLEGKYRNWDSQLLETYLDDLYNSTKFETWGLDRTELKNFIDRYSPQTYEYLVSLIYKFYAVKEARKPCYWGDKNSLWIEKLDKIKAYYPNAFIVHLIRDGRDVACSYKEIYKKNINTTYAPKLPNEIAEVAENWNVNNISIEKFLKKFPEKQHVQIKYEELLSSPKSTLQKILDPLGLEMKKAQLEYYLKDKNDIEPAEFFNWKEKLVQPPDINNAGKYLHMLSQNEINEFNRIAYQSLSKYNYI